MSRQAFERALSAASKHFGRKALEWFQWQGCCPTEQHGYGCTCYACSGEAPCPCPAHGSGRVTRV